MTYKEALKEKGYSISRSSMGDLEKDTFTAIEGSSFIYCTHGLATLEVNMMEYTLRPDSYISIPDDSLVKVTSRTNDFSCIRLTYSKDIGLSASMGLNMDTMHNIFVHPFNQLTDSTTISMLLNLLNALADYFNLPNLSHHSDFVMGLIRNLFIAVADVSAASRNDALQSAVFTSADSYFLNFIKLLNQHCCQQHDVAFYADKLSITPKYLNEIARKTANRTAKDIISKFIVARIKRELLISGNSVQRIAYDFNFCDQSSLGKFFKKATGMSPVAFRRSHQ
ncbi:MAG: helix-turn-helix domain-containing protein [Bacteroidales bacterium]|nr:helix-turn-helix domain-containing protein [Bacteroidales bacterium]